MMNLLRMKRNAIAWRLMAKQRIDLSDILEQTALIVDDGGRESLSLAALADGLGVQASALYNHVDGVDGLWHDFAVHATDRLAQVLLESAVAQTRGGAVSALAHAYRAFSRAHPGQFASSLLPPSSAEDALFTSHARIIDVFARVVASFEISADQLVHHARTVRSAVHGFVALESIDGMPSPEEQDVSFEQMIDFLICGLESL
jgi:AcrR family transcriptional regulator